MKNGVFGYHSSKQYVHPDENKRSENIKGLELEISDSRERVQDILDDLIDDNILTAPCNADEIDTKVCIENDGSVYKELVFKADKQRNILKVLKNLNEYGLNPENVKNHRGTSAHIHLNRDFLESLDLYERDILKAGEYFMGVAFKTSGRDYDRMEEWAQTVLNCDINADLITRGRLVDRIDEISYNRYNAINCGPSNTIEFRIFSNYCSFDYNTIKYFIEYTDRIIDIAENMKDRSYEKDGEIAIDMMNEYFNKYQRRQKIYSKYNLSGILMNYEEIKEKNKMKRWNEIQRRIENFERYSLGGSDIKNTMEFIRLLRHIDEVQGIKIELEIEIGENDYDNLLNIVRNKVKEELKIQ